MGMFKSIILAYKNENRLEYQLYAEFFRLAGIYVGERQYDNKFLSGFDWKQDSFSTELDIDAMDGSAKRQKNFSGRFQRQRLQRIYRCLGSRIGNDDLRTAYGYLMEVFIEYDLYKAGVVLQYFKLNEQIVRDAGKQFRSAAGKLGALMKQRTELSRNKNIYYASLYCRQKANMAAHFCKCDVIYPVEKLGQECVAFLKSPYGQGFSNLWVLLGLIYEFSDSRRREAIDAFVRALQEEEGMPYAANIYYWIGKRCEDYETEREVANQAYCDAYNLMKKYRNIYKRAMVEKRRSNYRGMLLYLEECLAYLGEKKGKSDDGELYLDPLEQEYFFKINVIVSHTYLTEYNDYFEAIRYGIAALKFREGIEEGREKRNGFTAFFYDLFDEKASCYIDVLLGRMGIEKVCGYLAKAYREIGMQDKAEEYLKVIK